MNESTNYLLLRNENNHLTHRDDLHVKIMMIRFQLSDYVNHVYVTYTVDLLSITENTLYYTPFDPDKGPDC